MNKLNIPRGFKGVIYEPTNEQETIALFLLLMPKIKPTWCIYRMQKDFPDATFYDTKTGKKIKVEFEYLASSFRVHKSDGVCDQVICWYNNGLSRAEARQMKVKVLALRDIVSKSRIYLDIMGEEGNPDKKLAEGVKNKYKEYIAVDKLVNKEIPIIRKKYPHLLLDRKRTAHYGLKWNGKGVFGIYPDGRVVTPRNSMYEKRFGKRAHNVAMKFRHTVKNNGLNISLNKPNPNKELERRGGNLKNAIKEFCKKLEKLDK